MRRRPRPSRPGPARLARAFTAFITLVALTVGVPVALYLSVGPPFPTRLPTMAEISNLLTAPDDGTLLVGGLMLLSWGAWASFTWTVVTEVAGRIRDSGQARVPRALNPMRRLAAGLVAAATFTAGTPAVAALAVPPPPVTAEAPLHPLARTGGNGGDRIEIVPAFAATETVLQEPGERKREATPTYRVRPGDTLSCIAGRKLGSASKWWQIWKLNAHRHQADGRVFRNPHRIYPGWKLRLPARTDREKATPRRNEAETHSSSVQQGAPRKPRQVVVVPSATVTPSSPEAPGNTEAEPQGSAGRGTSDRSEIDTVSRAVVTVELPSGSVVGLAFAAGVSSALAASRIRRRKRRAIPDPANGVAVMPDRPSGDCVEAMHRAHVKQAFIDLGKQPPDDAELVESAFRIDIPTAVTIGERADGTAVTVPLHGLDLALCGPGAGDTARAIALELLTKAEHYRAQVIVSELDAHSLLGLDAHGPHAPGLAVTRSRDEACRQLEEAYRTRTRMILKANAQNVLDLLAADPGEVLPTTVLLIGDGDAAAIRDHDLSTEELARTGLGLLKLGRHDARTTCQVDEHGAVTVAEGRLAPDLASARLFHVTRDDAPEIVRILANSAGIGDVGEQPVGDEGDRDEEERPVRQLVPPHRSPEKEPPPVRLLILGVPIVEVHGEPIPLGRRGKAMELFIYLALHPEGVTREEICSHVWPEYEAGERFHSTLRHLRDPLREACKPNKALFVHADGDRYKVESEAVSVDLWDFHNALAQTRTADNVRDRLMALRTAANPIRGVLAEGASYEWIDEERFPLTRAQVDVLAQMSVLIEETTPEEALAALEQARTLDPDNEDVYRRIITLQLRLRRPDAAQRTAKLLHSRLAQLGFDPEPETDELLGTVARAWRATR